MLTDLDEAGLWEYRSSYRAPAGFGEFWHRTLEDAAEIPLDVRFEQVETGLRTVEVYDVTFAGYAGHPVRAWLRVPRLPGPDPAGEHRYLPESSSSTVTAADAATPSTTCCGPAPGTRTC